MTSRLYATCTVIAEGNTTFHCVDVGGCDDYVTFRDCNICRNVCFAIVTSLGFTCPYTVISRYFTYDPPFNRRGPGVLQIIVTLKLMKRQNIWPDNAGWVF